MTTKEKFSYLIMEILCSGAPLPTLDKTIRSYELQCKVCGDAFISTCSHATHCSDDCKAEQNRQRALRSWHRRQPSKFCAHCGQTLITACVKRGKEERFCSRRCRRKHQKDRSEAKHGCSQ